MFIIFVIIFPALIPVIFRTHVPKTFGKILTFRQNINFYKHGNIGTPFFRNFQTAVPDLTPNYFLWQALYHFKA